MGIKGLVECAKTTRTESNFILDRFFIGVWI